MEQLYYVSSEYRENKNTYPVRKNKSFSSSSLDIYVSPENSVNAESGYSSIQKERLRNKKSVERGTAGSNPLNSEFLKSDPKHSTLPGLILSSAQQTPVPAVSAPSVNALDSRKTRGNQYRKNQENSVRVKIGKITYKPDRKETKAGTAVVRPSPKMTLAEYNARRGYGK